MGVHGLHTYYDNNSKELGAPVILENMKLVVDGDSFFRVAFSKSSSDWIFGGDYSLFRTRVRSLLGLFRKSNVELCFFFDGAQEVIKADTGERRIKERTKRTLKAIEEVSKGRIPFKPVQNLPPFTKPLFRAILAEEGFQVRQSHFEADRDIAKFCKDMKWDAVLSTDSDYLVFDAPGYIPLTTLVFPNSTNSRDDPTARVRGTLVRAQKVAESLGLPIEAMPIFGWLLGNDFSSSALSIRLKNKMANGVTSSPQKPHSSQPKLHLSSASPSTSSPSPLSAFLTPVFTTPQECAVGSAVGDQPSNQNQTTTISDLETKLFHSLSGSEKSPPGKFKNVIFGKSGMPVPAPPDLQFVDPAIVSCSAAAVPALNTHLSPTTAAAFYSGFTAAAAGSTGTTPLSPFPLPPSAQKFEFAREERIQDIHKDLQQDSAEEFTGSSPKTGILQEEVEEIESEESESSYESDENGNENPEDDAIAIDISISKSSSSKKGKKHQNNKKVLLKGDEFMMAIRDLLQSALKDQSGDIGDLDNRETVAHSVVKFIFPTSAKETIDRYASNLLETWEKYDLTQAELSCAFQSPQKRTPHPSQLLPLSPLPAPPLTLPTPLPIDTTQALLSMFTFAINYTSDPNRLSLFLELQKEGVTSGLVGSVLSTGNYWPSVSMGDIFLHFGKKGGVGSSISAPSGGSGSGVGVPTISASSAAATVQSECEKHGVPMITIHDLCLSMRRTIYGLLFGGLEKATSVQITETTFAYDCSTPKSMTDPMFVSSPVAGERFLCADSFVHPSMKLGTKKQQFLRLADGVEQFTSLAFPTSPFHPGLFLPLVCIRYVLVHATPGLRPHELCAFALHTCIAFSTKAPLHFAFGDHLKKFSKGKPTMRNFHVAHLFQTVLRHVTALHHLCQRPFPVASVDRLYHGRFLSYCLGEMSALLLQRGSEFVGAESESETPLRGGDLDPVQIEQRIQEILAPCPQAWEVFTQVLAACIIGRSVHTAFKLEARSAADAPFLRFIQGVLARNPLAAQPGAQSSPIGRGRGGSPYRGRGGGFGDRGGRGRGGQPAH